MTSFVRSFVSKKKKRFKENGFDLDLSYITPRIIAMGFPSEGREGIYRNPLPEVVKFLSTYHDRNFKVINLCAERDYDPAKFGGNVERIPFEDHQPAPINVMLKFCRTADDWLSQDENNVLVTHCKAGKGRSGVMICAYLLYIKYCPDPLTAMQFYGEKRTKNGKGVTIPSQRRYIGYFHDFVEKGPREDIELELAQISFTANIASSRSDIYVVISSNKGSGTIKLTEQFTSLDPGLKTTNSKSGRTMIMGLPVLWISGDVKFEFLVPQILLCSRFSQGRLFYFWFNTAYIEGTDFSLWSKQEVDKPLKSLESDIQVSLFFTGRRSKGCNSDFVNGIE